MTFERLLHELSMHLISPEDARKELEKSEKHKTIVYYSNIQDIAKHPLKDAQLAELQSIVKILQILDNNAVGSPVSDTAYDNMQEMLVSMGIPRLTGTIEINSDSKVSHTYTNLRGTLGKVYYLSKAEKQTNKNRKYLDDWIEKSQKKYESVTGKQLDFNQLEVIVQPKFDGVSCILEVKDGVPIWITRGDTKRNLASDVSHIMRPFNDVYVHDGNYGIKFEVMMTEENKDRINSMIGSEVQYKNSRQIVTATINATEPDFKVDYLYLVPLRYMDNSMDTEILHPDLLENFPTIKCRLKDRDLIKKFADEHKYIKRNGMRLRTDGAVITIIDPEVQRVLGRENDINQFEIAYKFTEEVAYTKVKRVEFYVSEFGRITPVLVVNDVIMKGNTINHISLANKERFDELGLCYGDEVKVLYDIIPYVTLDEKCRRAISGRKIPFTPVCPKCGEPLDLTQSEVQCENPRCISRILGQVLNYCDILRIQNIGYSTLEALYLNDLLPHGIRSLYKLKKHSDDIQLLDGFGKLKTKKMISEIEAKRRLMDYEFFGAIGIQGLSVRTFQLIFHNISLEDFLNMIRLKNLELLNSKLIAIKGIGEAKAALLTDYFKDGKVRKDLMKLLDEVTLIQSYGVKESKGRIVFTGCRPTDADEQLIKSKGYDPSDNWSNNAKFLVVPSRGYESSKVEKARERNIPIITIEELRKGDVAL